MIKSKTKLATAVLALPSLLITNQDSIAADKTQEEPTVLEKVVVTDKKTEAKTLTTSEITATEISSKQAQVSDKCALGQKCCWYGAFSIYRYDADLLTFP